ncbi:hypothetical protein F5146DRAFT_996913 [Armillaria mellea]|nr:hypothetical protein F5146DRAFT_996913 [Armillaria mellea]
MSLNYEQNTLDSRKPLNLRQRHDLSQNEITPPFRFQKRTTVPSRQKPEETPLTPSGFKKIKETERDEEPKGSLLLTTLEAIWQHLKDVKNRMAVKEDAFDPSAVCIPKEVLDSLCNGMKKEFCEAEIAKTFGVKVANLVLEGGKLKFRDNKIKALFKVWQKEHPTPFPGRPTHQTIISSNTTKETQDLGYPFKEDIGKTRQEAKDTALVTMEEKITEQQNANTDTPASSAGLLTTTPSRHTPEELYRIVTPFQHWVWREKLENAGVLEEYVDIPAGIQFGFYIEPTHLEFLNSKYREEIYLGRLS